MEPRPDREKELFLAALQRPIAERHDWLQRACGGDGSLFVRTRQLLDAHDKAGSFLADPGADVRAAAAATVAGATEQVGETIGAYKLLENIGEGGFGAVWMAEQREPVRRLVAMKVLKAGMDSAQVVARFEQERQALALMTHPNIAQVFDAGTTDRGRPFFVMELVKGVPITDYCAREKLPVRARLDLFVQVCRAVQHAHGKGLIHRDIKPRNVLVATADGKPLAKVIDFGIAKATGARLTEKTLFTEHRAMVGTLEYMSPEQAEGLLDVDTRSDVYSLGALLYELLTGSTPFDSKELVAAGYAEILRMLREVEPQRPSVRVSSKEGAGWAGGAGGGVVAAGQRGGKELFGVLKGELDWVVMKALEKDRGRRYASADGLAEDVERYLVGDPVRAVPPSIGYRMRKFVRRNKALLGSSAAILLTVFVAAVVTTVAVQRAVSNERAAEMLKPVAVEVAMALRAVRGFEDREWLGRMASNVERLDDPDEIYASVSSMASYLHGAIVGAQEVIEGQRDMARGSAHAAAVNESLAYLAADRPVLAAKALERCQESLRNWEWFYARTAREDGPRLLANKESDGVMCGDGARYAFFDGRKIVVIRLGTWEVEAEHPLDFDLSHSGSLRFPSRDRLVVETDSVHWVLDPTTGAKRAGFDRSTAPPGSHACAWTRDASRVATANDKGVVVWDVDSGARIRELDVEGALYWSSWSFSHDGRFLAQVRLTAGTPRSHVWRIQDGVCIAQTKGTLALNPFGSRSLSSMGEVVDLSAGSVVELSELADAVYEYCDTDLVVRTAKKRTDEPNSLVWPEFMSPQVRSLVDGRVTGLPASTLRPDAGLQLTADLARKYYCDISGTWGSICVSTGQDLDIPVFSWLHQSGDGKWLLNSAGRLYAMAARPPSRAVPTNRGVLALANAPTEVGPRTITRSGSHLRGFDEYTAACVETPTVVVDSIVGSQDGRRFLERRANDLMVVDAATSQSIVTLSADAAGILAIAISHDGSSVAACDATSIRWWDMDAPTNEKRITLDVPVTSPSSLSVHGDKIALGVGNAVSLYSVQSDAKPARRVMANTAVTRLLFQPDGSRLFVATSSGELHVMNVPALDDSAVMNGHSGPVAAIAWSHDGDRVFSAGDDGTVRVWYVEGSLELLSLSDPEITGKPTCLLFPPDGERLICGYDDGSIRVWDSVPWSERVDRRNAAVRTAEKK